MATWKIAAALAAGCTVVLKPSEVTPLSALQLARIVSALSGREALPPGVLNVLPGTGAAAGAALSSHRDVSKIAFTGSVPTGSAIMHSCADDIRNVSLELGGKSAVLVFPMSDEELLKAAEWVLFGIFWTNGQICSATSRLLVHESIAERFTATLIATAKDISLGKPLEDVKMGPLVNQTQYDKVMRYIREARADGATIACGGGRPDGKPKGYFVEPTIITDVAAHMSVWREEIFGPVLCVRTFSSEAEAITLANATDFGLAAAVFSSDKAQLARITAALDVGIVWQNCDQPCFCSLPWGGPKRSGIGRDNGEAGFMGYLEVKQVVTREAKERLDWYTMRSKL